MYLTQGHSEFELGISVWQEPPELLEGERVQRGSSVENSLGGSWNNSGEFLDCGACNSRIQVIQVLLQVQGPHLCILLAPIPGGNLFSSKVSSPTVKIEIEDGLDEGEVEPFELPDIASVRKLSEIEDCV